MTTKGAQRIHNLAVALPSGGWVRRAACRPEIAEWYWPLPGQNSSREIETALKLCSRCPVVRDCGQWALDNHMVEGIWGGMRPGALRRLVERARAGEPVKPFAEIPPPCLRCRRPSHRRSRGLCKACHSWACKRKRLDQYPLASREVAA